MPVAAWRRGQSTSFWSLVVRQSYPSALEVEIHLHDLLAHRVSVD